MAGRRDKSDGLDRVELEAVEERDNRRLQKGNQDALGEKNSQAGISANL